MPKIKLVKNKTNEMSGTGGSASATPGTGAQYAAPKAFPRVAADYNKTFGTHFAPSIPNRPSKAITYKELWEIEGYEHLRYLVSDLKNLYYISNDDAFKKAIVDVIPDGNQYQYILSSPEKYIQKLEALKQMLPQAKLSDVKGAMNIIDNAIEFFQNKEPLKEAGEYDSLANILRQLGAEEDAIKVFMVAVKYGYLKPSEAVAIMKKGLGVKESTDDADFDSDTTGAEGLQSTNPLSPINEARYTEFKKMTQVRTPGEQLHRAIREIRRKIDEINKLVSYTEKMKTEMKSDANEVNYLKRTKEALSKISAKIQETNNKIKRLVQ